MTSSHKYNIALEDMEFFAYHGVYQEEQKIGRKFLVSVYLDCTLTIDGTDKLGDTYNYEWIYEIVKDEMSRPKKLIETIAHFIALRLKEKSGLLNKGRIKISKEGLAMGGKVARSIIELKF